jgi:Zn-dependent peptidase ImmA (M78 family)
VREELERDEVVAVVDCMVEELLQQAGVIGPPIDALALARRHLGMQVCLDRRQQERGRAQRAGGRRQIFLRPEPTEERHQWTIAHKIGEHFKPTLLTRLGIEPSDTRPMAGESLANLFAYRLLVPTCWFSADAPARDYELLALKQLYATASHEVIAWRFLDLPAPSIVTVMDNGAIHRRRSNDWRVRRQLEPAEERCQRYVNETGRPRVIQENGWVVQGWPVHREGWRREILRSVVEASDAVEWAESDFDE